jgi:hypothetical protein
MTFASSALLPGRIPPDRADEGLVEDDETLKSWARPVACAMQLNDLRPESPYWKFCH